MAGLGSDYMSMRCDTERMAKSRSCRTWIGEGWHFVAIWQIEACHFFRIFYGHVLLRKSEPKRIGVLRAMAVCFRDDGLSPSYERLARKLIYKPLYEGNREMGLYF